MQPTATLISYLHTCTRKLWLHANEIRMEHTSDIVAEGKLIGATTYERRSDKYSELELSLPLPFLEGVTASAKMDFYDHRERVVHETKRGKAMEVAHEAQVKFYLYLLRLSGVTGASGVIEYPEMKITHKVALTEQDIPAVESWIRSVCQIIEQPDCPAVIEHKICKKCSFYDLCYAGE